MVSLASLTAGLYAALQLGSSGSIASATVGAAMPVAAVGTGVAAVGTGAAAVGAGAAAVGTGAAAVGASAAVAGGATTSVAAVPSVLAGVLLGLLQGLTEFLPISSSGHLVLAQSIFQVPQTGIVLEVVLHAGTLLAVLCSFRKDLWMILVDSWAILARRGRSAEETRGPATAGDAAVWPEGFRTLLLLVAATLPVVVVGLLWKDTIEGLFESPRLATVALMVTGVLLLSTRWIPRGGRRVSWATALAMGCMQVLSLMPGISRSGATITGGLFVRGAPEKVARFSFLMSIPAIAGSLVLELPALRDLLQSGQVLPYAAGFVAAFLSGLAAIEILLRIVARGRFFVFGAYCLVAGLLGFLFVH